MSDQQPEFVVPCGNHPDQRATHNCMNCGKPLCMACVDERGYYCSDACKEAVQAAEPSAPRDASLDKVDAQMERGMAVASSVVRKLIKPVVIAVVLVVAFYAYRTFFGPKGTVTVNVPVNSEVATFHAELAGPDAVIVRANDELYRLKLSTQAKEWTVNLQPFEPEQNAEGFTYRDRLEYLGIRGDEVWLRSREKLLAFDAASGVKKWEAAVTSHSETLWGDRFVEVNLAPAPKKIAEPETEPEITAGDAEQFSARRLLGLAKGESPAPKSYDYLVTFQDARTGAAAGNAKVAFPQHPTEQVLGDFLVLTGGRNLAVFRTGTQPLWQTQLGAAIVHVAQGADVVAVATEKGVTVFAAESGQQRWARDDLAAHRVAIGPDGTVYAQVYISPDDAKKAEDKYRFAKVALAGMSSPLAQVPVLLKLDAKDGQTRWGVRNIGTHVLFTGSKVLVADATEQMNLLAASGPFQGYYSVRQINPRNGDDVWSYVAKGLLYEAHTADEKPFLIAAEDLPSGRKNPVGTYLLQVVEGK